MTNEHIHEWRHEGDMLLGDAPQFLTMTCANCGIEVDYRYDAEDYKQNWAAYEQAWADVLVGVLSNAAVAHERFCSTAPGRADCDCGATAAFDRARAALAHSQGAEVKETISNAERAYMQKGGDHP